MRVSSTVLIEVAEICDTYVTNQDTHEGDSKMPTARFSNRPYILLDSVF